MQYNALDFPHDVCVLVTGYEVQHLIVGDYFFGGITVYTLADKFNACWILRDVTFVILYETDNFDSVFLAFGLGVFEERASNEVVWAENRRVGLLENRIPMLI